MAGGDEHEKGNDRYAGHPITAPTIASTVLPHPYPKALYIAGAKSGKPNPAQERRQVTAARAGMDQAALVLVRQIRSFVREA